MVSPQTLSLADRRLVAAWAADCAERVLPLFEAQAPEDPRPRHALARCRAYSRDEITPGQARSLGGEALAAAREVATPVAATAARAAAQAAAVAHMGAHALGAAAYAVKAVGLAEPDRPEAVGEEIAWQIGHLSPPVRVALRDLPAVGTNRAGPLGPGLLSSGLLGDVIRRLQAAIGGSG